MTTIRYGKVRNPKFNELRRGDFFKLKDYKEEVFFRTTTGYVDVENGIEYNESKDVMDQIVFRYDADIKLTLVR